MVVLIYISITSLSHSLIDMGLNWVSTRSFWTCYNSKKPSALDAFPCTYHLVMSFKGKNLTGIYRKWIRLTSSVVWLEAIQHKIKVTQNKIIEFTLFICGVRSSFTPKK